MILNNWQSFILTKLIPVFESLGSVLEIIATIVLFVLLPALVYACKKSIDHCQGELKRQSHLLHSQAQTLSELNIWMQYFDEMMIKRENGSLKTNSEPGKLSSVKNIKPAKVIVAEKREPHPDHQVRADIRSTPVSIYKKTI